MSLKFPLAKSQSLTTQSPQQENTYDCGIFALNNANVVLSNVQVFRTALECGYTNVAVDWGTTRIKKLRHYFTTWLTPTPEKPPDDIYKHEDEQTQLETR